MLQSSDHDQANRCPSKHKTQSGHVSKPTNSRLHPLNCKTKTKNVCQGTWPTCWSTGMSVHVTATCRYHKPHPCHAKRLTENSVHTPPTVFSSPVQIQRKERFVPTQDALNMLMLPPQEWLNALPIIQKYSVCRTKSSDQYVKPLQSKLSRLQGLPLHQGFACSPTSQSRSAHIGRRCSTLLLSQAARRGQVGSCSV